MSGGYAGAKRMQWLATNYAAAFSEQASLGVGFQTFVTGPMVAGTGVGDAGSLGYSRRMGITQAQYLERFGKPISPAEVRGSGRTPVERSVPGEAARLSFQRERRPCRPRTRRAMTSPGRIDARKLRALLVAARPELHRYASRMLGSSFDGEDIVQDVAERALKFLADLVRRRRYAPGCSASRTIASSMCCAAEQSVRPRLRTKSSRVRKPRRRRWSASRCVGLALNRFGRLPVTQRGVLILKDVLELTLDEIVETLGLSMPTVKAAPLHRAAAVDPVRSRVDRARFGSPWSGDQTLRGALQQARLGRSDRAASGGSAGFPARQSRVARTGGGPRNFLQDLQRDPRLQAGAGARRRPRCSRGARRANRRTPVCHAGRVARTARSSKSTIIATPAMCSTASRCIWRADQPVTPPRR